MLCVKKKLKNVDNKKQGIVTQNGVSVVNTDLRIMCIKIRYIKSAFKM